MLTGLILGKQLLYSVQQLAKSIADEGVELLAEGLLSVISKGKSFILSAPHWGTLKQQRLRSND